MARKDPTNPRISRTIRRRNADPVRPQRPAGDGDPGPAKRPYGGPPTAGSTPPGQPPNRHRGGGTLPSGEPNRYGPA